MTVTAPAVGQRAPDFALPDQYGKRRTLAELVSDRAALLVFYPFAFSGICAGELHEIRDDLGRFQNDLVNVAAISCDPMFSLRAWDDKDAFFFPLLSDFWPHGEVSRRYGVFEEQGGFSRRGTFLVDAGGVIRWTVVNPPSQRRDFGGFHATLAALSSA